MHELVPYLRDDGIQHDFGHHIHELSFEGDDEYNLDLAQKGKLMKQKLGIEKNPLDGAVMLVSANDITLTSSTSSSFYPFIGWFCTIHVPILPQSSLYTVPDDRRCDRTLIYISMAPLIL